MIHAMRLRLTYFNHRHGAQGTFDTAAKSTLENEFGTSKEEAVVAQILEKGNVQESEVRIFYLSHLTPQSHRLQANTI